MKKLYITLVICLSGFFAHSQLTMNPGLDTASLSNLLEGLGVDINGMTINCKDSAYGQFSGVSAIPITNGIALSTGSIVSMDTTNTGMMMSEFWNYPGDADLDALIMSVPTYDACVIEFDAVPIGDTLAFNFSFGSEEYLEYVLSSFNDVFAIYISGAGFPTPTNIAVLPNDTIVSINNVNHLYNSSYFNDNTSNAFAINWDGFTDNIQVETVVVPSTPYHFKIAIADAGDGVFNSGVFLEAFSFRSMSGTLGTIERTELNAAIYPNPFTNELTITTGEANYNVTLYNAAGILCYQKTNLSSSTTLDLSELPDGAYQVVIGSNTKHLVKKLMKTK